MKTLVIPDIHEQYKDLLALGPRIDSADKVVCLGDYFDTFGVTHTPEVAAWVAERIVNVDKFTFLLGNHDTPYLFGHREMMCSGHKAWKTPIVLALLAKHIDLFHLCVDVDGYILSHAGWHPSMLQYADEVSIADALLTVKRGEMHPLFGAGASRGGNQPVGGIVWLDFKHEFVDIDEMPQIVGHTKGPHVRRSGESLCIDTGLEHVAWIEDGKVEVEAWKLRATIAY